MAVQTFFTQLNVLWYVAAENDLGFLSWCSALFDALESSQGGCVFSGFDHPFEFVLSV